MLKLAETILDSKPTDPAQNDYHRALVLPAASNLVYRSDVPSPQNINSAAGVYYEVGSTTDYDQLARLHLFAQIAKVPIFSTVRCSPSFSSSLNAVLTSHLLHSFAPKKPSATSSARPSGASTSVKVSA